MSELVYITAIRAVTEAWAKHRDTIHEGDAHAANAVEDAIYSAEELLPQHKPDFALYEGWKPIATAPRDGTPFIWMHYITVLHMDKPHEYDPQVDIVRRRWINEEKAGRQGDGFWMGKYGSRSDDQLSYGWWRPLPLAPKP